MKLLLVEDNLPLAERIKKQLCDQHYLVDVVNNGEDAVTHTRTVQYSGIILDLGLPKMSGVDVCRTLREADVRSPILILTGESDTSKCVELLDIGADDYLTKPFNKDELRARVAALVRRQPQQHHKPTIKFGDIEINIEQRKVYRAGTYISLRRKEFDILEYMVRNCDRILTRDMIMNNAWETTPKSKWYSTVDVHIKHLRDKIDRPYKQHIIHTAYGLGYKIELPKGQN